MKRFLCILCFLALLTGCAATNEAMDRAMAFRTKLLASAVTFDASITADFGDKTYTFSTNCSLDAQGELTFKVTEPESIAGISGKVSAKGGKLTFDDHALAFEMLADGQVTPVTGPWILMNTLRSGYLTSCGAEGDRLRLAIDDSYQDDALHLDIWLDEKDLPQRGEILWQGRRVLSIAVSNFEFQ